MKTPSPNFQDDAEYIDRFVSEEWIGKRLEHKNLVKVISRSTKSKFLYYLMEELRGQNLADWLTSKEGNPGVEEVVKITTQIVDGVRALHRKETLHQDLKLENVFIDPEGNVKVIDFGSCNIGGLSAVHTDGIGMVTIDYAATEYRIDGASVGVRSDQFSIAMIAYRLLSGGKCPYGANWDKAQNIRDFSGLDYTPVYAHQPMVPVWIDGALKKALQTSSESRYYTLSEFITDLKKPNSEYVEARFMSIIEKDPLLFWKVTSAILLIALIISLIVD